MPSMTQFDVQGYAVPFAADDEVIECGPDARAYGEPESWPAWTDQWTFEEGPAIPPDAMLEPFEPSAEDWEEAALIFDRMEMPPWPVEYPGLFTEADARAAGLAV